MTVVALVGLGVTALAILVFLASLGLRRVGPTNLFFVNAAVGAAVAAVAGFAGAPAWPAAVAGGALVGFVFLTRKELSLPRGPKLAIGPGDRLPEVTLRTTSGAEVATSALARPALIVLYRGWWCPYCVTQLGDLGREHQRLRGAGLTIYAVSVDRPEEQVALERRLGGAVTFLSDVPGALVDALGVRHPDGVPWYDRLLFRARRQDIALPASLVVDAAGVVRFARRARAIDDRPAVDELLASLRG